MAGNYDKVTQQSRMRGRAKKTLTLHCGAHRRWQARSIGRQIGDEEERTRRLLANSSREHGRRRKEGREMSLLFYKRMLRWVCYRAN
jgi:hypothetical protein